jgi:hypothetical protein
MYSVAASYFLQRRRLEDNIKIDLGEISCETGE